MAGISLVKAAGSGPDVVLVHGFGADRLSWLANQAELGRVGTVWSLDLPGHGASPFSGDAGLPALAAAVADAMDAAGVARAAVVGHSLGGAVAVTLAALRPERVRGLALLAPAGLGGPVDEAFLHGLPEAATAEAVEDLLRRLVSRPRLVNRMMVAGVLAQLDRPGARDALRAHAGTLRRAAEALAPHAAAVAAAGVPRLVLWGAADTIVPLDAERIATFGGALEILDGAVHLPQVEAAPAVNARLVDFLVSLPA